MTLKAPSSPATMSKQRSTLLPKRQQFRTSFALKFRPFDKVEGCLDIVAGVDRVLLIRPSRVVGDGSHFRQLQGS